MGCASSRGQGGCADFSLPGHADNEETEGSDVPADYLLGDVEADEDDLYMMDHENPHGERELLLSFGHPAGSSPALLYSFPVAFLAAEEQEYSLPQEAFPLRHEIVDNPSALDHLQDKADSPHVSGNEAETVSLTPVESFSLISISHSLYENRLPSDFFNPIVRDTLLFYAEQGDVQTAVSVLIVLGDRIRKEIDEQTQVPKGSPSAAPGVGDLCLFLTVFNLSPFLEGSFQRWCSSLLMWGQAGTLPLVLGLGWWWGAGTELYALIPRSTGTPPTSTCCSASSSGTSPTR